MSETLIGVIVGGTFGFLSAIMGAIINFWIQNKKQNGDQLNEIKKKVFDNNIYTSDILRFIQKTSA